MICDWEVLSPTKFPNSHMDSQCPRKPLTLHTLVSNYIRWEQKHQHISKGFYETNLYCDLLVNLGRVKASQTNRIAIPEHMCR